MQEFSRLVMLWRGQLAFGQAFWTYGVSGTLSLALATALGIFVCESYEQHLLAVLLLTLCLLSWLLIQIGVYRAAVADPTWGSRIFRLGFWGVLLLVMSLMYGLPEMIRYRQFLPFAIPFFPNAEPDAYQGLAEADCSSAAGCYEFSGDLTSADAEHLQNLAGRLWREERQIPLFRLNSPGGDLMASLKMGRLLRQMRASVVVLPNERCESACVFLLAGAAQRQIFGRVGIHRPYTQIAGLLPPDEAQKRYVQTQEAAQEFLEQMNVSPRLFEAMVQVPPETMRHLSVQELLGFGLLPVDPVEQEVLDSYYAGLYQLNKTEYLARKGLVSQHCRPLLQQPQAGMKFYLRCEGLLLSGMDVRATWAQLFPTPATVAPAVAEQQKQEEERLRQQKQLSDTLERIFDKYPLFDRYRAAFNAKAWQEVLLLRDKYMASGQPEPRAILRAADEVATRYARAGSSSNMPHQTEAGSWPPPVAKEISAPKAAPSSTPAAACEFKAIMSDSDYRACGLAPPGRNLHP